MTKLWHVVILFWLTSISRSSRTRITYCPRKRCLPVAIWKRTQPNDHRSDLWQWTMQVSSRREMTGTYPTCKDSRFNISGATNWAVPTKEFLRLSVFLSPCVDGPTRRTSISTLLIINGASKPTISYVDKYSRSEISQLNMHIICQEDILWLEKERQIENVRVPSAAEVTLRSRWIICRWCNCSKASTNSAA